MSNMKDYAMWLDDKGVATWDNTLGELIVPEGTNIHADELVTEYQNDAPWHGDEFIDDEDDEDEEIIIDDGDYDANEIAEWSPDEYWFRTDGGLTGDAMDFLYNLDSKGELV